MLQDQLNEINRLQEELRDLAVRDGLTNLFNRRYLDETLERELEWVRMGAKARQAKSKARLQKYEELVSEQQAEKVTQNEMVIPPAPRLGNDVVIADRLAVEFDNMYPLEDDPSYEPRAEDSIAAQAARRGLSPAALAYDRLLENDGKRMFYFPVFGYQTHDLSRQVAMLQDPNAIISLSDAGAHCGVLCDASMPTFMLSYLVRDRKRGERLALEWTVNLQTRKTARAVGLLDPLPILA